MESEIVCLRSRTWIDKYFQNSPKIYPYNFATRAVKIIDHSGHMARCVPARNLLLTPVQKAFRSYNLLEEKYFPSKPKFSSLFFVSMESKNKEIECLEENKQIIELSLASLILVIQ